MRGVEAALVGIFGLGLAYFAFSLFEDDRVLGLGAAVLVLVLFLAFAYGLEERRR